MANKSVAHLWELLYIGLEWEEEEVEEGRITGDILGGEKSQSKINLCFAISRIEMLGHHLSSFSERYFGSCKKHVFRTYFASGDDPLLLSRRPSTMESMAGSYGRYAATSRTQCAAVNAHLCPI